MGAGTRCSVTPGLGVKDGERGDSDGTRGNPCKIDIYMCRSKLINIYLVATIF